MISAIPEGSYCYELHVFTESTMCDDFDASATTRRWCSKHCSRLDYSVSGRVLKCDACLRSSELSVVGSVT